MHVSPSEFEKDLDVILACFRNEERPTPEQIEAIARVAKHTLVSLAGIGQSLRRIAEAQERLVRAKTYVAPQSGAQNRPEF